MDGGEKYAETDRGFHIVMGDPQARCMVYINGKSQSKMDDLEYPPS